MARVFYIECAGEVWRSVAQLCAAQANWTPVLWTAGEADERPVRALFPDVEFMTGPDAALGLVRPSWRPADITDAEIRALAPVEAVAIAMMDRMDGAGTFDAAARRRHYLELLRTWAGALEHYRPDRVIFSIAPHVVFDYVLYSLCRQRGIPTLMFERHGLPGWVFVLEAIDVPSAALQGALARQGAETVLPAAYETWLSGLAAGAERAVPANFARKLALYKVQRAAAAGSLARGLLFEAKRALLLLGRHGLAGSRNTYLRSALAPHGRARWLETEWIRLRGLLKKRRLARELERLCSDPMAGEPYVLLALHYQPERSTVPLGGPFGDQLRVVELLARTLPSGWRLYVKEHPWQLQPFGRGELQRPDGFYQALVRHPNVRLLPAAADTSSLIDGARAVATVSGSVGWQAMCRGVPALVFGEAWYRTCEGAFRIRSDADAQAALSAIAAGARVGRTAVRRFTAALAEACVPGILEPAVESVEAMDPAEAAKAMASALLGHETA